VETVPVKIDFGNTEDVQPWERQPGEPERSWAVFKAYRDLGHARSLRKAFAKVYGAENVTARLCGSLSKEYQWQRRAAAFDNYEDRRLKEAEILELAEMRSRHIRVAKVMLSIASTELQTYLEKIVEGRKKGRKGPILEVKEIRALVETATKLESVSRGQASEIRGHQDSGKTMSYADLVAKVEEAQRTESLVKTATVLDIKELPENV
jgi:hypothetical protein